MKHRLILLTDKAFLADVESRLSSAAPAITLDHAFTLADLSAALMAEQANTRIVSFGSSVIVPPAMLRAVGPAYNVHPGPPHYRGLFPSVYALYDNAAAFGVTCHEMSADIDSGAIVAVRPFPIPAHFDRAQLDAATYVEMLKMVTELAPQLCDTTTPLPHINAAWSGPVRRKSDFDELCQLPPDTNEAEIQRRYRAIGEGPYHTLTIVVDGQRVPLNSGRTGPVVRGGKAV